MEEPTSRYFLKVLRKPLERRKRRLQNELSTLKKSWKNLGLFEFLILCEAYAKRYIRDSAINGSEFGSQKKYPYKL
ncbi:hypothetical protein PanWU01x14_301780 [Parasponia andersonii]|uniref:Uncharacterized protein n=1 Tax=Parasponia andersonii TaxID=3476 RepID=A0A2P5ATS8_PARAD|nr:hypothetical protein PanWU01x14_301780 [Parasponia andersonii]